MPMSTLDQARAAALDLDACRTMLRSGSRTFYAASFLLPRRVREPASALYAFCRLADDAIDLDQGNHQALGRLSERLERAYAGRPAPYPADRAFAHVVARHAIPRELPEALIEGLAWDVRGRQYATFDELASYAARVAGAVGAMMTLLMGSSEPEVVARACELGVAMQLSNIARDVGEDSRAGRLYLPHDWLAEAGIDPEEFLDRPVFSPALGSVVQRLLQAADEFYHRAEIGIAQLPWDCRPGIMSARLLYAEIGREVERRGLNSVASRAVVSAGRKAAVVARIPVALLRGSAAGTWSPPNAIKFLIDAVANRPHEAMTVDWPSVEYPGRVGWLVELFGDLERRDRPVRRRA